MFKMNFTEKVYNLCRKIPKGKISTYYEIAYALNLKVYRAVGNALNKNKSKQVSCHRVVKSSGETGGFNKGAKTKINLLKKEGIIIKNNKINLKRYLYKF